MKKRTKIFLLVSVIVLVVIGALFKKQIGALVIPRTDVPGLPATSTPFVDPIVSQLSVSTGFTLSVFARNVKDARVITFDPSGALLVSQTDQGRIIYIADTNNDGIADVQKTIAIDLTNPHGLEWKCTTDSNCTLYVAEQDKLVSFAYDVTNHTLTNKKVLFDIPGSITDRHVTRTLQFLPPPLGDTLLISVGSSCNTCEENDSMRGGIMAFDIKKNKVDRFAKGLRNSVFMTIRSSDNKVIATEMGRDGLGDEIPPDEINSIEGGKDYGWPVCYGNNIHDTEYDKKTYIRNPCMEPFTTPSFIDIPAHSAPLGLAFVPTTWPAMYANNLLVAYHGSWNRSIPTGYKIVRMEFDATGKYIKSEDFISGWLTAAGTKIGRPVDLKFGPDSALYISDDTANVIYRLKAQ